MTAVDDSYDKLKFVAIEKYASNNCFTLINNLKEMFASDINSTRTLSYVSDISSLISVLEKRGVLSPINIEAFDLIYTVLQIKSDPLHKHSELLKHNEDSLFTRKYENAFTSNEPLHKVPKISEPKIKTSPANNGLLSDKVAHTVCNQIGRSWKSLARYLRVQECSIEQIEEDRRIKNDEIRARLVLDEFQQKEDQSEHKTRLLKALKLAHRMDIHDLIKDL